MKIPAGEVATELVCAGVRVNDKERLSYAYFEVGAEHPKLLLFNKLRGACGSIYAACKVPKDATSWRRGEFLRTYDDTQEQRALCAQWEAESDAAQVYVRAAQIESKAARRDWAFECLAPLRTAYQRADPLARQVILVKAIQAIRSPR